jgi:hypothetical protein
MPLFYLIPETEPVPKTLFLRKTKTVDKIHKSKYYFSFHVCTGGKTGAMSHTDGTNPHFPGSGTQVQIKTTLKPLTDKPIICWN